MALTSEAGVMAADGAGASRCVDVIIAAWNRADTIVRAVNSVAHEPCVRRVYVVDDASTDDTAARAQAIAAPPGRIEVVRSVRNGGPSAARNGALALSTAPWVAVLDGDDLMLPGRLAGLLAQADGWDLVADDMLQVPEGQPLSSARRLLGADLAIPERVTLEAFVLSNIRDPARHRREMGFLKPIMRRSFLDAHRLEYDAALRLGEDYILYTAALAAGAQFRLVGSAGYVSVRRANSLSAVHGRAELEALLRADRALGKRPGLSAPARRARGRHAGEVEQKVAWVAAIEAIKAGRIDALVRTLARAPRAAPHVLLLLSQELRQRTWRRWLGERVGLQSWRSPARVRLRR